MKNEYVDIIKHDPNYIELLRRRKRLTVILSMAMLSVYFAFILTIAYEPALLGSPISSDSVTSIGIPIGVFVIVFAFILTGIYTYKANREFDDLTAKIKDKVKDI